MKNEFIPYEQALELKQLGFDEPCFKVYDTMGYVQDEQTMLNMRLDYCSAPLYQQAFRWFRENYSTHVEIHENTDWEEDNESWSFVIFKYKLGDNDGMISSTVDYNTYEEAELACLIKLIEIVKPMTAEEFLQYHLEISYFYDDKTERVACYSDEVEQAMIEFAKFHLNNFSKQFDLSIWTKDDIIESYIKKHLK